MQKRNAEKRANRKSKLTPSQIEREKANAAKTSRLSEFYNRGSYLQAIKNAIKKGNKVLPSEEQIPNWFPYLLRHTAATETELEHGDTDAQALLGHKSVNTTKKILQGPVKAKRKVGTGPT